MNQWLLCFPGLFPIPPQVNGTLEISTTLSYNQDVMTTEKLEHQPVRDELSVKGRQRGACPKCIRVSSNLTNQEAKHKPQVAWNWKRESTGFSPLPCSPQMSATNNPSLPDRTDGANTEPTQDTVDCTQNSPDSELSHSGAPTASCSPFQQGKASLHPLYYNNGCGVPPQASVLQHQPQASKKQRVGSTSSVCTNASKKSCKSTASQIQEVAGDDCCALCALACLFCEFMSFCSLLLECGGCGGCLEACCGGKGGEPLSESCCGEAGGGNCPCGLGCGMLQDCCGSSDCLEICLECCSICFPA